MRREQQPTCEYILDTPGWLDVHILDLLFPKNQENPIFWRHKIFEARYNFTGTSLYHMKNIYKKKETNYLYSYLIKPKITVHTRILNSI